MLPRVTPRMARTAVLLAALGHGALSFILWDQGHSPSTTWLPSDWHYLVQALLAGPMYLLQWQVLSRTLVGLLRVDRPRIQPTCGWVLGLCTLGLLVVPDTVLYFAGGWDALRWGAPVVLATLFVGTWGWLSLRLIRLLDDRRWTRVLGATLVGLLAQAFVGAIVIR